MKLIYIRHEPHFTVQFDRAELKLLQESSDAHYDARCREQNQLGGMIYGMKFTLPKKPIEWELSWHEIDTLRKVLEVGVHIPGKLEAASKLSYELFQLLKDEEARQGMPG